MRGSFVATLLSAVLCGPAAAQQYFAQLGGRALPQRPGYTTGIAVGDVDGDGDADLVFGNVGQSLLHLNDGKGNYTDVTATHMPQSSWQTYGIALGDLDGDGDLDLVLANGRRASAQNRVLRNDGTGRFADVTGITIGEFRDATTALAMGDVDGDGDLDLVFGNSWQQDRLLLNDGTGSFTDVTATNLPSGAFATVALELFDADGDGDLDLAVGVYDFFYYDDQTRLYRNDGTGRFTDVTAQTMPAANWATTAMATADVDHDGDLDLLDVTGGGTFVYLNRNGVFQYSAGSMPGAFAAGSAVFGDVDGDGDPDLVLGASQDALLLNGGEGYFQARSGFPLGYSTAVALHDVDGDGDLDFVAGRSGQNELYLNDGAGGFGATRLPAVVTGVTAMAAADVDGDGDEDLALGVDLPSNPSGANLLYLNDGAGTFTDGTASRLPPYQDSTADLALADLDGDGDPDMVVANLVEPDRLFFNDGSGTFVDATAGRLYSNPDPAHAVAVADVDGDGDPDLVFANGYWLPAGSQQNRLYLNDGSGSFADVTATHLPAAAADSRAVALADVDGDGDRDLVFANNGQSVLYLNDGNGVFSDATSRLPLRNMPSRAVALVDVDGDGDQDLFLGNDLAQNRLYLNDGSGFFTDGTAGRLPAESESCRAVAAADVDLDGDVDLFVARTGQNRLLINDGSGVFTDVSATGIPLSSEQTNAVLLHDVDGDGDPDLVVGNWVAQNDAFSGMYRQLDTPLDPTPGGVFEITAYARYASSGPPVTALPLLAAATAVLPLPPFGTLRLDPSAMVALPPLYIPQPGEARSHTLTIPNQPGLVGATLYAQALFVRGADLHLSNLTIDVIR